MTSMSTSTSPALHPLIAPGAQVVVRDEEWLVRQTEETPTDGIKVRCIGTSPFVRDTTATFFTKLDDIAPLRPEETRLVADDSPRFRDSRLYLEAMIRKTPVAGTETGLAVADQHLLQELDYQRQAAHKALTGLRPRLLIADAVGLGKTLEVGLILSELIRRGRGEKILVVTPRHILEQFQHELWTRFAIPLVRLDSEGIQRVRREIPANRNPFTHFKRSIISIDTLKNAGRYRHHLEGIRWDAVVIDECHNLVNRGTLNNQLARVLAPRTEALLLTSATPHNGDPESFAELIRLLDPTAIADPAAISADDIAHLYVRRHKHHDDVAAEVASDWAERLDPMPIRVRPTPAEEAVFAEIADTWTHPRSGAAPTSGQGRSLFPWTLYKAAMSSHKALAETVAARRRTLATAAEADGAPLGASAEDTALARLEELVGEIDDTEASKLARLVEELNSVGVGGRSATRAVIFSERIATLEWLAEHLPGALGLKPAQILSLHGGMADLRQMDVIEQFGLADSEARLLLTGDMASEGVNLHRQCHHLIHFDLPWSLITIEQRNGRIDRYGQTEAPEIRALLQAPERADLDGDLRIVEKLLEREHQAHKAFGDSGSLLGLHHADAEADKVTKAMREGADPDSVIPAAPADGSFDLMALVMGDTGTDDVPTVPLPTLFDSEATFVDEALAATFDDPDLDLDRRRDDHAEDFLSVRPPADLVKRLAPLPKTYLAEQAIAERLKLTGDIEMAEAQLAKARNSTSSIWPDIAYLSPQHPFTEWLVDKLLVSVGRNQAPVITCAVDQPWFCIQGMFSNGRGQPQLVEWMAVTDLMGEMAVRPMFDVLDRAGVSPEMANRSIPFDAAALEAKIEPAVVAAKAHLEQRRADHESELDDLLEAPTKRLDAWVAASRLLAATKSDKQRADEDRRIGTVRDDTAALIASMRTVGQPLVRVVACLTSSS